MIDYQVGSIVAYHLHNLLQLGKITAIESGYISFEDSLGQLTRLPVQRFCLFSSGVHNLAEFYSKLMQRIDKIELRDFQFSAPEGLSWEDYALQADSNDDLEHFARYFFIRQHPELFIWKKHKFRPRDNQEQDEYSNEQAKNQERVVFLDAVSAWLEQYLQDSNSGIPEDLAVCLRHELPDYLLTGIQTDLIRTIARARAELDLNLKIRLIRLGLGQLRESTDPILADSGLPVCFAKSVPMDLLKVDFPPAEGVEAFCVDDEDSEDFDDALSLTKLESGYRIGIHISAVAARIPYGSELYREAAGRVSSLYLAPGVSPLLPEELSNQELSLVSGSHKACLSFYIDIDPDAQIQACRFCLETVVIKQNYSYREVDRLLYQAPFSILGKFSSVLCAERGNQAQSRAPKDYYYFLKTDGKRIRMRGIDQSSPARVMIEELMVLFNRKFADYAIEHEIPLIFRNINQFSVDGDEYNISSQAYLSTTPDYHPGIGSNAYVHATSPIRRFTDLVNQYQLINKLSGRELPFNKANLEALITPIEERLLRQREVIQKSGRYWLLKLIEQDYLHIPLYAEVQKYVRNGAMVELTEWHKRIQLQTDSYAPLNTEVQILITQVFPEAGYAVGDIIS